MLVLAKNTGPWNIFIMPELCRDQKVLQKLGHIECHIIVSFLEINDAYLNLNTLYEFECEKAVATTFKKDDFVLPGFNLKLELENGTLSDNVKNIFQFVRYFFEKTR